MFRWRCGERKEMSGCGWFDGLPALLLSITYCCCSDCFDVLLILYQWSFFVASSLRPSAVAVVLLFYIYIRQQWNLKEQKVRYVRVATHDVSRDDRFADATPFLIHSIRSASAKIKDLEPFTYHQRVAAMVLLETNVACNDILCSLLGAYAMLTDEKIITGR